MLIYFFRLKDFFLEIDYLHMQNQNQLPAFSLAERTYYAVQELQLGKRCVQLRI